MRMVHRFIDAIPSNVITVLKYMVNNSRVRALVNAFLLDIYENTQFSIEIDSNLCI